MMGAGSDGRAWPLPPRPTAWGSWTSAPPARSRCNAPLSGLQDAERTWPGAKLANASLHRSARERCTRSAFRIF